MVITTGTNGRTSFSFPPPYSASPALRDAARSGFSHGKGGGIGGGCKGPVGIAAGTEASAFGIPFLGEVPGGGGGGGGGNGGCTFEDCFDTKLVGPGGGGGGGGGGA